MLFNSLSFLFVFVPLVLIVFFFISSRFQTKASNVFLLLASLFFYSCWELKHLYLFLVAVLVNFSLSKLFQAGASHQKKVLATGITLNLLFLAYFKYFDFFMENASVFWGSGYSHRHLILPLGISFYTFQQMAYLIDAYREGGRKDSLLDYALFISFFPQLVAGPILHHNEFIPQMKEKKTYFFDWDNFGQGLCLLSLGLFKKVAIADSLGIFVNIGFADTHALTTFDAWVTSLSFTFQSYFDFAGYSDMALGLGLFFNLRLPPNFDNPFRAINISDFWRRWHITLTRLFEGYLYFPLAMRFIRYSQNELMNYLPHLIIFTLIGLWHGGTWGFVIFGFLHGCAIVVHKFFSQRISWLPRSFSWIITFIFVNITLIFYRAPHLNEACSVLSKMVSLNSLSLPSYLSLPQLLLRNLTSLQLRPEWNGHAVATGYSFLLLALIFAVISCYPLDGLNNRKPTLKGVLFFGFLFGVSIFIMTVTANKTFIYFNF